MSKWWFAEWFPFTPLWLTIQAFASHHLLFRLIVSFTDPEINPQGNLDLITGCTNTQNLHIPTFFPQYHLMTLQKKPQHFLWWSPTMELFWLFLIRHFQFSLFFFFYWDLLAALVRDRWCHLLTAHQSGLSNRICSVSESDDCRIVWLLSVKCNQNPSRQSWWNKLTEILTALLMNNSRRWVCLFFL